MLGLSFLSPLFLVGAAAAAVPVLLHLFHRRAEPVINFAAMRYLRVAPVEQASRRRLKEWLLLALRVTALILLALAFARPYFVESTAALTAHATVVLVDTSASMSAPGQFERARQQATDIVRALPVSEAVAVAGFASGVDVVAPLATDRAAALEAIASLQSGAGTTRYRTALARGADALQGRDGRIVVVTDLQRTGWDAADSGGVPEGIEVDVVAVPAPAANVALISLQVEGAMATALVRNFSTVPQVRQVSFDANDRRLGAVGVNLPPSGAAEARLPISGAARGSLRASVDDGVGYAADNSRYVVIDSDATPSVLIITTSGDAAEAFYVQRALAVTEGAAAFRPRIVSGLQFSNLSAAEITAAHVIVLAGTRGIDASGRQRLSAYVRDGGGLLIAADDNVDAAVVRDALGGQLTTSWRTREHQPLRLAPSDSRHPVFRVFAGGGTLGGVTFRKATLMTVGDAAAVLARFSDGSPAVVEEQAVAGRVIVFAGDLNRKGNDFPVQPPFVPFLHETVRYLSAAAGGREYLVGDVAGPRGSSPGVIRLRGDDGPLVAINVDPREADPSAASVDEFEGAIARMNAPPSGAAGSASREREDTHRLWQYALVMVLVSLAAESVVGRRLG